MSFEVCQVALLPPHPTLHTLDPLSELSTIHTLLGLTTTPLTNPPSEEPRGATPRAFACDYFNRSQWFMRSVVI